MWRVLLLESDIDSVLSFQSPFVVEVAERFRPRQYTRMALPIPNYHYDHTNRVERRKRDGNALMWEPQVQSFVASGGI